MYLNVIQLAESFGVEESVVEGWVRNEGLPCVPDRGRLLFDRAQVVSWAAQRGLAAKAGFLASERTPGRVEARLAGMLKLGGIWRDVPAAQVSDLLETIVARLPGATPSVRHLLSQRVRASDGISWAPVGRGLALPHLRASVALGRNAAILALLLLREALPQNDLAPDDVPVTRLLFFIAPSPRAHLDLLAQLSAALTQGGLCQRVLEGAPDNEIIAVLAAAEAAGSRIRAKEAPA